MMVEDVKSLSTTKRFVYWIVERYQIMMKKNSSQPKPWTNDEIMMEYKFCNVRRMDDRVSRWLMDNWYRPYFDHPNMLQAVGAARLFNLPNTLAAIEDTVFVDGPVDWGVVEQTVADLRDTGNNTFNSAYIVGTNGVKEDKVTNVVNRLLKQLDGIEYTTDTMRGAWQRIGQLFGFGSFNSGQIVADLRWAVTGEWKDKDYWAPVGPGSRRGMNRLLDRPLKSSMNQEQFITEFHYLLQKVKPMLPKGIVSVLEAMDYQNCLCEFDKYERTLAGEGRPKCKYPGRG